MIEFSSTVIRRVIRKHLGRGISFPGQRSGSTVTREAPGGSFTESCTSRWFSGPILGSWNDGDRCHVGTRSFAEDGCGTQGALRYDLFVGDQGLGGKLGGKDEVGNNDSHAGRHSYEGDAHDRRVQVLLGKWHMCVCAGPSRKPNKKSIDNTSDCNGGASENVEKGLPSVK